LTEIPKYKCGKILPKQLTMEHCLEFPNMQK